MLEVNLRESKEAGDHAGETPVSCSLVSGHLTGWVCSWNRNPG